MSEDQALFIGRTGQAHSLTTNERALSDEIDERDRIIERLQASEARLLEACEEFVRKVECGEARSTRSYAQMKAAIAAAKGEK